MTAFAATIKADTLSETLAPISAIVDECKLHATEDGLEICAVDPATVARARVALDKTAFEAFDTTGVTLGVNLERLEDVLSMAEDELTLELIDDTHKLRIESDGLEYTLALIDTDSIRQEPDIPDLDLPATFVLDGGSISRGIKAADLVAKHITIAGDGETDSLILSAEGDTDDVTETLAGDRVTNADVGESCESMFSLYYLKDISKPIGSSASVTLRFGDEFPLKMRYYGADGPLTVTNMLAPRIQSD